MFLLAQLDSWFVPGEISDDMVAEDFVSWGADWMTQISTGLGVVVLEVVTTLGVVVGVIVAAFFAFLLIRKALRWVGGELDSQRKTKEWLDRDQGNIDEFNR